MVMAIGTLVYREDGMCVQTYKFPLSEVMALLMKIFGFEFAATGASVLHKHVLFLSEMTAYHKIIS